MPDDKPTEATPDEAPPTAPASAPKITPPAASQATASLYDRIGGADAVKKATELFYDRLLADSRVSRFFSQTNMDQQKGRQYAFLAAALGGPKAYDGKALADAHAGLAIEDVHFDIVSYHLTETLNELGVDPDLVGEVQALIESQRDAVLNRKS